MRVIRFFHTVAILSQYYKRTNKLMRPKLKCGLECTRMKRQQLKWVQLVLHIREQCIPALTAPPNCVQMWSKQTANETLENK